MPRLGKVESLPHKIREQVHQRLLDGQPGSMILPWLNDLPETRKVITERFDGIPVSEENLSAFRTGPHREWVQKKERVENIRLLSQYASRLASAAGGSMSQGAQAIATGRIMEILEASAYEEGDLKDLVGALANLRSLELQARNLDLKEHRLDQNDRSLDLAIAKFQRETAELFLKWYDDESAKRIAAGKEERSVKVDQIRQLMFGENPNG